MVFWWARRKVGIKRELEEPGKDFQEEIMAELDFVGKRAINHADVKVKVIQAKGRETHTKTRRYTDFSK